MRLSDDLSATMAPNVFFKGEDFHRRRLRGISLFLSLPHFIDEVEIDGRHQGNNHSCYQDCRNNRVKKQTETHGDSSLKLATSGASYVDREREVRSNGDQIPTLQVHNELNFANADPKGAMRENEAKSARYERHCGVFRRALCFALLLVSIVLTGARVANASPASAWFAPWGALSAVTLQGDNISKWDSIWMVNLKVDAQSELVFDQHQDFAKIQEQGRKYRLKIGPVLHNMGSQGFDISLGRQILRDRASIISKLKVASEKYHFNAINIDIESLGKEDAVAYEAFIAELARSLKTVEISVSLHAKTSDPGENEASHFQRWDHLSKLPVKFVIMAYDYAWSTSAPGPIAPSSWVKSVAQHGLKFFSNNQLSIGLPLYGYYWQKSAKGTWQGEAFLPQDLQRKIVENKLLRLESVKREDGQGFEKAGQAIYFDDSQSLHAKWKMLQELGIKNFAVWRMGGEEQSFYQNIK